LLAGVAKGRDVVTTEEPGNPATATESDKPLEGAWVPADCGPPHRLRPDIAAALLWGPLRHTAATAAKLITRHLRSDELVVAVEPAWIKDHEWGLLAVTTRRVLYVADGDNDVSFYLPIEAIAYLIDGDESNASGHRKASLIDLERNIPLWIDSANGRVAVENAISRAVSRHTCSQPGYETAKSSGIVDDFERYAALVRARDAGALDDAAMMAAVDRLFGLTPGTIRDEGGQTR
jgi:hypothetical protein